MANDSVVKTSVKTLPRIVAETGCAKSEVTTSKQMMTNISVSMMDSSLSKASSWRYQQQLIDVEIKSFSFENVPYKHHLPGALHHDSILISSHRSARQSPLPHSILISPVSGWVHSFALGLSSLSCRIFLCFDLTVAHTDLAPYSTPHCLAEHLFEYAH